MFFLSDYTRQFFEVNLGLSGYQSVLLGSIVSGYVTGFAAGLNEWGKVLQAVSKNGKWKESKYTTATSLVASSRSSKTLPSLFLRLHSSGTRNAIFDSTFFTSCHHLASSTFSQPSTYALSAVTAVVVDYAFDVSCKRSFSRPPALPVSGVLKSTLGLIRKAGVKGTYRGAGVKAVEFGV
eukprot:CAMPEP_0118645124 /NCGR_PEP_ID=MMETSP0785-20121206/7326_1 /TAXON_ID=91992 /ORGANISM="Bolidomonas pacifica, Strain CCMP 1866" /LENGTH=179 /DNA_ID=CAMNT_0006536971 /DNA_START=553 /DNA_END=1088 /DNA_ORIENTATION=-